MLSPLRTRFGIPGVISVIALVFAMFGGAYAATNDGGHATASAKGKPGPRGKTGKTGPAGPAGPQGPAGPAGANGKDGANGSNGTNGVSVTSKSFEGEEEPAGEPCEEQGGSEFKSGSPATYACNGKVGKEGPPGPSCDEVTGECLLPSGATETGVWAGQGIKSSTMPGVRVSLSYPLRVSFEPTFHYVKLSEFQTPPAACPGLFSEPKAEPGNLCIYERGPVNIAEPPEFCNGILAPDVSSGCGLEINMETEGVEGRDSGSWAVTAP